MGASQRVAELVDADERAAGGGTGRRCGHDDREQRTHHRRDEPITLCHDRTPLTGRKPSYCPPRSYGTLRRRSRSAAGTIRPRCPRSVPPTSTSSRSASAATCSAGRPTSAQSFAVLDAYADGRRQLHRHGRLLLALGRGQLGRRVGDDHRPLDGGARQPRRARDRDQGRQAPGAPRPRAPRPSAPRPTRRSRRLRHRPHRPLLRAHRRPRHAARARRWRRSASWSRPARCATSARPTTPRRAWPRRSRPRDAGGLARYVALQPHYNLVERDEYEGELADLVRRARASACMPYFALATGFLTGKYRPAARTSTARAPRTPRRTSDERGARVLAALDEIAAAHGATVAAVALAWLAAAADRGRADRERAHARAAGRPAAGGRTDVDRRRASSG